ncbi:DUF4442 domain-containing protein [Flavicella sediminum]|uniref:DUF4442 domain-containing protein n=1 Tax=Flavicella sediminum TaxID=2585141 RepID=UPI0011226959|nr:DUF4442 domain-containing protein [Flavicella sediminum]
MTFTPRKLNWFLLFKIPSAYLSGVRVKDITETSVEVGVRFQWINQNPFKSMYWATQGMASELATGVLMMQEIAKSKKKISMLVVGQQGEFTKKAVGKISFSCVCGEELKKAIAKTIATGDSEQITLVSEGTDESGAIVSKFHYNWSIKLKAKA